MRTADVPPLTRSVRLQDEQALFRADENPYPAHRSPRPERRPGVGILLVPGHRWIDHLRPAVDAAGEAADLPESGGAEKFNRLCAAPSDFAKDDDVIGGREPVQVLGKCPERDVDRRREREIASSCGSRTSTRTKASPLSIFRLSSSTVIARVRPRLSPLHPPAGHRRTPRSR